MWLCDNLPRKSWNQIYVLGSWYGNMGLILRWSGIDFDRITNIDMDPNYCQQNRQIYKIESFDRPYRIFNGDCNKVRLDDADLVINTSTNDIRTHDWFRHIPKGTTVAIQCRNNQPIANGMDRPATFKQFLNLIPLRHVLMSGKISLSNADEHYDRYMMIGRK
jgi:hypothetical protein